MEYYFNKTLKEDFDNVITKVTNELKNEGFGVLTEINVNETLRDKLGIDFKRYQILGACNPPYAHKALEAEDKIGTMLPCNVIVQQQSDEFVEVAAINPLASMQAVNNEKLHKVAKDITSKLQSVINRL
ncbi:DUF302 domain-containing protein [Aquimarina sp. 2-A2]|uniref:DUF302 domain-containing protein n=1 Tax=Leeuwenhoekiella nanhaiensis TaxID=1655491 RepID=A0A2G1VME0_9FLAO|nr:DUF302 domain-containing protein [Leeuwenhoekiella nanhaiensis]PHQ27760.1 hypothetical protein CJ305_18480 [Leeuwenhoekiella nanhaiensis]PHR87596.1 MAG: hypothetical protein COA80_18730 [Leeuwenhoekiella sp.]